MKRQWLDSATDRFFDCVPLAFGLLFGLYLLFQNITMVGAYLDSLPSTTGTYRISSPTQSYVASRYQIARDGAVVFMSSGEEVRIHGNYTVTREVDRVLEPGGAR